MARSLAEILEKFDSNGPPPTKIMLDVEKHRSLQLPSDYKAF